MAKDLMQGLAAHPTSQKGAKPREPALRTLKLCDELLAANRDGFACTQQNCSAIEDTVAALLTERGYSEESLARVTDERYQNVRQQEINALKARIDLLGPLGTHGAFDRVHDILNKDAWDEDDATFARSVVVLLREDDETAKTLSDLLAAYDADPSEEVAEKISQLDNGLGAIIDANGMVTKANLHALKGFHQEALALRKEWQDEIRSEVHEKDAAIIDADFERLLDKISKAFAPHRVDESSTVLKPSANKAEDRRAQLRVRLLDKSLTPTTALISAAKSERLFEPEGTPDDTQRATLSEVLETYESVQQRMGALGNQTKHTTQEVSDMLHLRRVCVDAKNNEVFVTRAEKALKAKIDQFEGKREDLAALLEESVFPNDRDFASIVSLEHDVVTYLSADGKSAEAETFTQEVNATVLLHAPVGSWTRREFDSAQDILTKTPPENRSARIRVLAGRLDAETKEQQKKEPRMTSATQIMGTPADVAGRNNNPDGGNAPVDSPLPAAGNASQNNDAGNGVPAGGNAPADTGTQEPSFDGVLTAEAAGLNNTPIAEWTEQDVKRAETLSKHAHVKPNIRGKLAHLLGRYHRQQQATQQNPGNANGGAQQLAADAGKNNADEPMLEAQASALRAKTTDWTSDDATNAKLLLDGPSGSISEAARKALTERLGAYRAQQSQAAAATPAAGTAQQPDPQPAPVVTPVVPVAAAVAPIVTAQPSANDQAIELLGKLMLTGWSEDDVKKALDLSNNSDVQQANRLVLARHVVNQSALKLVQKRRMGGNWDSGERHHARLLTGNDRLEEHHKRSLRGWLDGDESDHLLSMAASTWTADNAARAQTLIDRDNLANDKRDALRERLEAYNRQQAANRPRTYGPLNPPPGASAAPAVVGFKPIQPPPLQDKSQDPAARRDTGSTPPPPPPPNQGSGGWDNDPPDSVPPPRATRSGNRAGWGRVALAILAALVVGLFIWWAFRQLANRHTNDPTTVTRTAPPSGGLTAQQLGVADITHVSRDWVNNEMPLDMMRRVTCPTGHPIDNGDSTYNYSGCRLR